MADGLDGENGESCGYDGGELTRILQHLVIARHESGESQLVESDDKLTIVEIREPLIDAPKRQKVDVDNELMQTVEDGNGEVVIERYVHLGRQLAL